MESERFHAFTYDELMARDKANLDITWLRDDTLDDASNLPAPGVLAAEIVEELEAALAQFTELAATLPISIDAMYADAYDEHPISEPGAWGDLASFRSAT